MGPSFGSSTEGRGNFQGEKMETTTEFWNDTDREVSDILDQLSDDVYELKYWVNEYDHGEKTNSICNAEALSNIGFYLSKVNRKVNRISELTHRGVSE